MLAKPVMRRGIPPSHRKIYFMYLGLAQVISKAFVKKYQSMQTYKFEQVLLCTFALASNLYYNCYKLLGGIIIGLIATSNAFIFTGYWKENSFL